MKCYLVCGVLSLCSYALIAGKDLEQICTSQEIGIRNFVSAVQTSTGTNTCLDALAKIRKDKFVAIRKDSGEEGEIVDLSPLAELGDIGYVVIDGRFSLRNLGVLKGLVGLTGVSIDRVYSIEAALTPGACYQPKLRNLDLKTYGQVTEELLRCFSGSNPLEELDIPVAELATLKNHRLSVRSLKLSGEASELEAAFSSLHKVDNLEVLNLNCDSETTSELNLSGLQRYSISKLKLSSCHSVNLESLGRLIGLKELQWYSSSLISLDALSGLTSLEALGLGSSEKLKNLNGIRDLKNLKTLSLGWCALDDESLKPLSGLTSLESLDLNNNRITGTGLVYLAPLTKVWRLDLDETEIGDDGLTYFKRWASSSSLKHLRLFKNTGAALTGKTLDSLQHIKSIQELQICYNKIDNEGLKILAQSLPNLTWLAARGNDFTDQGIRALSVLRGLKTIVFGDNTLISKRGLKSLTRLPKLEELLATSTSLSSDDAEDLMTQSGNPNLKVLAVQRRMWLNDDL